MPVVPFAEYKPDVSDYSGAGQYTKDVLNVVPRGDGYGPMPGLNAFTSTLGSACRGHFYARKTDGTVAVFAGTGASSSSALNLLDNSALTWSVVSSTAGYAALSGDAQWQFAQFNKYVIAVQQNAAPQVYSLTSSTGFTALGGSPPQAAYIAVVNRFLVLGGIAAPNTYRVQWSGLNDTANWTSGVNQSDFQDFADGGFVRGIAGGEFGVILQDSAIRRMTYAPGSPYIFGFDRIAQDDGLFAPYSLIGAADRVFYCANNGFKMITQGGYPHPIGKERIDRTFFADVDSGNLQLVIGVNDPRNSRVFWAYKSINGASNQFDKLLCYDYALDKWTLLMVSGEYIASLARPGITLEQVDSAYGSNIDTITLASLDDISTASLASISAFDSAHKLAFFVGNNLEAILETGEQGGDGKRVYLNGIRPITDAETVYGSISKRATAASTTSYTTEQPINSETGVIPAHIDTRYARGKIRIPAAEDWSYAAGIEPEVITTGKR